MFTQVELDSQHMHYILHVALVVVIAKGHISNVLNHVCGVITGLRVSRVPSNS